MGTSEGNGRPTKKRKTWFADRHQGGGADGMASLRGNSCYLVTCDQNRERMAIAHASNFISAAIEELKSTNDTNAETPSNSLDDELKELKKNEKNSKMKSLEGGRGLVFMVPPQNKEEEEVNPVLLVKHLLKQVETTGQVISSVVHRVAPLEVVTESKVESMVEVLKPRFSKYVEDWKSANPGETTLTFAIQFNKRYCDKLDRNLVIKDVGDMVTDVSKSLGIDLKANLSEPQICILIEACKSIAGISLITGYSKLCKLNIRRAAEKKSPAKTTEVPVTKE